MTIEGIEYSPKRFWGSAERKLYHSFRNGFIKTKAELLGSPEAKGGVNVQWQSARGDVLQIVTNFSPQALPRPPLIMGETLWGPSKRVGTSI